jgi:hypothetical protein
MAVSLSTEPADPEALEVPEVVFLGVARGAATGGWSGSLDLRAVLVVPVTRPGRS